MYAHQVIEDEKKYFPFAQATMRGANGEHLGVMFNVQSITKAQHFHVGEYNNLARICRFETGMPLEIEAKYLKMPFAWTWIDAFRLKKEHTSRPAVLYPEFKKLYPDIDRIFCNKLAAFVSQSKDDGHLSILGYYHYEQLSLWLIMPILQFVFITNGELAYRSVWLDIYDAPFCPTYFKEMNDESAGDILGLVFGLLKLIHCKNITTEKIPAPHKLNRKRARLGKQELFDYHVLNVITPSQKRESPSRVPSLSHNRVHLCRGHFKEYTQENPLFGRHTGLYWWQPHVRGQNRDGVVMKDYSVKHKN